MSTERWYPIADGDPRGRALFHRHYSSHKNRRQRSGAVGNAARYVGPGAKMLLLTVSCDAVFAWRKASFRHDGQTGAECSIFRNESSILSSELIIEACDLAWSKWPGERLFTYVDPLSVRWCTPAGWCFLQAGFRYVLRPDGTEHGSKAGALLLERLPGWGPLADPLHFLRDEPLELAA